MTFEALPLNRVSAQDSADGWLARFHAGDRAAILTCYQDHFTAIRGFLVPLLGVADAESVVHELFVRLLAEPELRANFSGGSLSAWLRTVARRAALDYLRKHRREAPLLESVESDPAPSFAERANARLWIDKFRSTLPRDLEPVFELRFVMRLDQREAAARMGISKTALLYHERRVTRLLRKFMLRAERPLTQTTGDT